MESYVNENGKSLQLNQWYDCTEEEFIERSSGKASGNTRVGGKDKIQDVPNIGAMDAVPAPTFPAGCPDGVASSIVKDGMENNIEETQEQSAGIDPVHIPELSDYCDESGLEVHQENGEFVGQSLQEDGQVEEEGKGKEVVNMEVEQVKRKEQEDHPGKQCYCLLLFTFPNL